MRLINSYMTKREMEHNEARIIYNILSDNYKNIIDVQRYKYEERKYYETDFDLLDITFNKTNIYDDIDKLIKVHELVLKNIEFNADIIIANDDTETEIQIYEKDINNISNIGLFITKRYVANVSFYYSSSICNAYLNLDCVSFGVYF